MLARLLGPLGDRWPWIATALRVQERVGEVRGGHLASAITLSVFLSIFPLLLAVIAVIGFLSSGDARLAPDIVRSLGLTGQAADSMIETIRTAEESRRAASAVGLGGLFWSGLGVVGAISAALDVVWQVQSRGVKDKLFGLLWLLGAGLIMAASVTLSTVLNFVPLLAPLTIFVSLAVGVALWLWTFKALTNIDVPWRAFLPGAVAGAVALEILKAVGAIYVPRAVASSSALYGSIGVVFAILAWLFILGRVTVYCAVLNVVRWEEDHGTVSAQIELPRHPGDVVLETTRGGDARASG